jgi:uncharacterized membrane protein YdbT with pleckstrin-like domain
MADEKIIMIRHESRRRPMHWIKAIFTLGIWLISWRNNYLALTERSIVRRKGVFTKEERAVPLNHVQDISISYGFTRQLLGLGDIRIETASGDRTEIIMNNVDKPDEFRSKVFEMIDQFYGEEDRPTAAAKEKKE